VSFIVCYPLVLRVVHHPIVHQKSQKNSRLELVPATFLASHFLSIICFVEFVCLFRSIVAGYSCFLFFSSNLATAFVFVFLSAARYPTHAKTLAPNLFFPHADPPPLAPQTPPSCRPRSLAHQHWTSLRHKTKKPSRLGLPICVAWFP
jgi:hypothetical protein